MRSPLKLILYFCILLSGFSGLVYEIIWLRVFSQLFGNTLQSASVVLAAFFLGLSYGSYLFGKKSGQTKNPLRLFAFLELGIFASALPLFLFHSGFQIFYPSLYRAFHDLPVLFTLIKIIFSFLIITGPAFFMGGTLPLMATVLVDRIQNITSAGGILYGVNTLGAALGAVAAGMVLPPVIGVQNTFYLAAAINCGNFVFSWLLSQRLRDLGNTEKASQTSPAEMTQTDPVFSSPNPARYNLYLAGVAFVSGFALLQLEVLWNRMFSLVFHNSVYTFTAVVVIFLFALGLGALLIAVLERQDWDRNAMLSVLLLMAGISSYITPFVFVEWTDLKFLTSDSGWSGYLQAVFGTVLGVIFIPVLVGGMILPLIWKLFDQPGVGLRLGKMNAVNTLGTITGSLSAGFLAIPLLGIWSSIALVAVVYLVLTDISLHFLKPGALRRRLKFAVYSLIPCIVVVNPAALPVQKLYPNEYLAFLKEGSQGTVSVVDRLGSRVMKVNNHYTLGGINPVLIEQIQAQLPLFLHPDPQSVAFIGLATGITAGGALPFEPEEIHIAEIIPEVVEAAGLFAKFNHDVLNHPKVRVHEEDGRNFILGTDLRFDVVIGDLFVPNHAGTGYLYTREHFTNVLNKLRPGGIFCQWLSAYEVSPEDFKTIAATFRSVFPVNSVWMGDFSLKRPLIGLLGIKPPYSLSKESLSQQLQEFNEIHPEEATTMFDISNLLLLYMGSLEADETLKETPLNTDQNLRIEFSAPIHITNRHTFTGAELLSYLELLLENTGREENIFQGNHKFFTDSGKAGLELIRAIEAKLNKNVKGMVKHILAARQLAPESSHLQKLYEDIERQISDPKA